MPDLTSFISDGVSSLLHGWFIKVLVALAIGFVGPMQDGYAALLLLMILDLVLGVARAAKEGRLNGRIARYKTVIKLVVYWSVIAASYQLSVIIAEDLPVRVAVFYLGTSEFVSVYRNGMAALGRPPLPPSWIEKVQREFGENSGDD